VNELIRVENLVAGYGAGPDILNGLSLTLEEGRTYCIIGPNGAGKSTLLKTVGGLLTPRAGSVTLEGRDIAGRRPDELLALGICMVPQDPSLFPRMTVRQNLVMGGFLEKRRAVVRERVEGMLSRFPLLAERQSQLAGTLSGGQQQVLLMARALMGRPRVMMIDEPSLGLSPQATDQVFEIITGLNDQGITVLLIEQNVERGLAAAHWAFVLDLGRLRFEGPSDQILDDPRIRELYLGKAPSS
jgi:ABC-type branched-subunit amino acid transport system ATPase component